NTLDHAYAESRTPELAANPSPSRTATGLLLDHPYSSQPALDQVRPFRNRETGAPQPERMPALYVQMQLDGNSRLPQCIVIDNRVLHRIYRIILGLKQERRRCTAGEAKVGIQHEPFLSYRDVPRVESD